MNFLLMFFALIILSFYFYPFELAFISGANTKMCLAAIGLIVYALELTQKMNASIDKKLFYIIAWALLVSFVGLISVSYNDTHDYSYATYIVSMFVWMFGAYAAVKVIKLVHGFLSVDLLCNYLIVLTVVQCCLALAIDSFPFFKQLAHSIMVVTPTMEKRLYGIDASLDIAGSRFSVVLVIIMHCCFSAKRKNNTLYWIWSVVAFCMIAVVGNMISRTTTIGILISFVYWIVSYIYNKNSRHISFLWTFSSVILLALPIIYYFYHTNPNFHNHLRFGFEGFFSMAEKGHWEVHSNDILANMYVFPETLKTWIIGDGYFDNPYYNDPYFTGRKHGGYYMSTDVGYLRFIFYFGLTGLTAFVLFFINVCRICIRKFPEVKILFLFILAINFIVWFKVSTDIFLVFALFICMGLNVDDSYIESKTSTLQCQKSSLDIL